MQLPQYTGLAGGVATGLEGLYGSAGFGNPGNAFGLNPFMAGGQSTSGGQNPLVAGLTPEQMQMVQKAFGLGMGGSNMEAGAQAGITSMLDPTYAGQLAQGPETQKAITAATNPLVSAFNQTTLPGLAGQFTASGQRVNAASRNDPNNAMGVQGYGKGSSAFGKASAMAQGNLLDQVGKVAGGISNQAYQTGLAQQSQAINQSMAMSQTQVKNLVDSLQAVALPQMIQQYGIDKGVQLFQDQLKTVLSALGLGGNISQPAIGYEQESSATESSTGASPGILQSLGNLAMGGFGIAKSL